MKKNGDRETHYRCMVNAAGDAELLIYDDIGESWFGGITAKMVDADLKAAKSAKKITVRINSQGGDVFEAFAIYNQLKNHPAKIAVSIEGLAASSASVIAMAGDTIDMAESSWMMIHDPWTVALGNAADMRAAADLLDQMSGTIRNIYTDRTGLPTADVQAMMRDETWIDAYTALEKGFATSMNPNLKVAAHVSPEFARTYRHTPADLVEQTTEPSVLKSRAALAMMSNETAVLTGKF